QSGSTAKRTSGPFLADSYPAACCGLQDHCASGQWQLDGRREIRRWSERTWLSLLCHCAYQGGEVSYSWLLRQRLLRRSRGVRGSADHQHGTRSLSNHVFCHTAQKHMGESRPPMRPHDNQIHPLLDRCVQNRLRGGALDEEALSLEPGTLDPLS